jgi:hypothetical protein
MEDHNEPMDEFRWEEFMKKSDEIAEKLADLMEQYKDDPNLDNIIAREMGWHIVSEEDENDRAWISEMNEAVEETIEDERTEEWKRSAGMSALSEEAEEMESDPLYMQAYLFATDCMRWCKSLPDNVKDDPDMDSVMEQLMIPAAKIAGSTVLIGDEESKKDMLGLRIANFKRGLQAANNVLNGLSVVRERGLIDSENIFPVIKQGTELRNALALRIVEVREQFNNS